MRKLWRGFRKRFRRPRGSPSPPPSPARRRERRRYVPPRYAQEVAQVEETMKQMVKQRRCAKKYWSSNDFEIGKKLGRGAFGEVRLAREIHTKFVVALKELKKPTTTCGDPEDIDSDTQEDMVDLLKEIEIQAHLIHPYILRLYNYFWDDKNIFLILEYAALGPIKVPIGGFPPVIVARYVSQVAMALQHCHAMNVVHRDLKPENLLLDVNGDVKLADFGLSAYSPSQNQRESFAGTHEYLAPEIITGMPYWSKVDNWALGILAFELLTTRPPFGAFPGERNWKLTYNRIVKAPIPFPQDMEAGAIDLISRLLVKHPTQRYTLKQVLEHPWIGRHTLV